MRTMTLTILTKDRSWIWGPSQKQAFENIKELITSAPTLAFYNPDKETVVSADASSFGLGALLSQKDDEGNLKPVAYASRSLNSAERNYAQIEKECLAITWACERFERYLIGLEHFVVLSDHKPLIPIINKKDIPDTPIRCQRMLIRLMRFNLTTIHTAGKNLVVADTLSRAPLSTTEGHRQSEIEAHINQIKWPASDRYLQKIKDETEKDPILTIVLNYIRDGWPTLKADVKLAARNFFPIRGELSYWEGIITKGDVIVVPHSLMDETLEKIHTGHFGVTKCKERARQSVWWPGISTDIVDRISSCAICIQKSASQRKEPMIPSEIPERPYQKVGTDLFEIKGKHYVVIMDYYSKNIDIEKIPNEASTVVIEKLKKCFALNGIPECVFSDNGPCFHSNEFQEFAKSWNFSHTTSSPRYPQANGQAESAVKIAKQILKQEDPHLALLSYRATPVQSTGYSPAELSLGRKIKTTLPILPHKLLPKTLDPNEILQNCKESKEIQKKNYDNHHGTKTLPILKPGDPVYVKTHGDSDWSLPGRVRQQCASRSFLVDTPNGILRRNRLHLKLANGAFNWFPGDNLTLNVEPTKQISVPLNPNYLPTSSFQPDIHKSPECQRNTNTYSPQRNPSTSSFRYDASASPQRDINITSPRQNIQTQENLTSQSHTQSVTNMNSPQTQRLSNPSVSSEQPKCTRSGRPIMPPTRFQDYSV